MQDELETRYAECDGLQIAYQVFGEGQTDLVISFGFSSNCDSLWDIPTTRRSMDRLKKFFRIILFDRRGSGQSDPLPADALPTWEDWSDDIISVMDAVGSARAVVHGERDGGCMALLFAAMHPDRVEALSLANATARFLEAQGYSIGLASQTANEFGNMFRSNWGTAEFARRLTPTLSNEEVAQAAKLMRDAVTPRQASIFWRYIVDFDGRAVLPSISARTLILSRSDNPLVPMSHGKFLAEQIPDAQFKELEGGGGTSIFMTEDHAGIDALVKFATGQAPVVEPERTLATLLFCDIVDSTRKAAEFADRRWHELLTRFYTLVRDKISIYGGREIDTAGDGFFISFDRPTKAIRCACAIRDSVRSLGLQVRCGLHTGECIISGAKLAGMAVHVGARIASAATPDEVWISETVRTLTMGSGISVSERGSHELKGVPERWSLYAIERIIV